MNPSEEENRLDERSTKEFVYLMSVNQMNIYAYIMAIVGNSNDADDIMQNTSVLMWDRYSEFKKGTDFVAWGRSIAYYKIKEFRKQQSRHQFSNEVLEIIHRKSQDHLGDANLYIEKLRHCLAKLPPADFDLVKLRYESGNSVKRISMRVNTTVQAVYIRLSKIHGILSRCIKQSIVQDSF